MIYRSTIPYTKHMCLLLNVDNRSTVNLTQTVAKGAPQSPHRPQSLWACSPKREFRNGRKNIQLPSTAAV